MTAITACTAPPGSQEWLDARQQGIGGSDIATLLGHNPYATPLQLWRIKMGMETDPFTGNYATKRGQHMERFLLDTYAEARPGVIIETAPDDIPSIVRHADVAAAMVSLDALAHDKLSEQAGRRLKLISGVVMAVLGLVMLLRPDWLT